MSNKKVSVCIPCYDMRGRGDFFLRRLLNSLVEQENKNFEVVVSDHSTDDNLKNLCEKFGNIMSIVYVRNEYKRGNSSANANVAISNSSGDIVKVMFQDDFFVNKLAISEISTLENGWAVTPFIHTDETESKYFRPFLPAFHDKIALGQNTIGCPSIVHFVKTDKVSFDEDTIWLMDCDFYQQLYRIYGQPTVLKQINVAVRIWADSVSGHVNEETKNKELQYIKGKYGF